mgnify:FL=1
MCIGYSSQIVAEFRDPISDTNCVDGRSVATLISDMNSVHEGRRPASSKTNYVDKLDDLTQTQGFV